MFFKGRWGGKCRKERDRTKKLMIVVVFLLCLINTYQKNLLTFAALYICWETAAFLACFIRLSFGTTLPPHSHRVCLWH